MTVLYVGGWMTGGEAVIHPFVHSGVWLGNIHLRTFYETTILLAPSSNRLLKVALLALHFDRQSENSTVLHFTFLNGDCFAFVRSVAKDTGGCGPNTGGWLLSKGGRTMKGILGARNREPFAGYSEIVTNVTLPIYPSHLQSAWPAFRMSGACILYC